MTEYQIYNEDCMTTMKSLSDGYVDLIITSPPYNLMTQTKYNKYIRRVLPTHSVNKYSEFDDSLFPDEFYSVHSNILKEMLRVSKIVLYNFQIVTGSKEAFFRIIGDFRKYIKDIIVWDKERCLPASRDKLLNVGYELILIMEGDCRLGRTITNAKFERSKLNNIIKVKRNKFIQDGDKHNAVMPEELTDILINSFSEEGDIVYDPFMGTGTTLVSAIKHNRQAFGSDVQSSYCDIAQKE